MGILMGDEKYQEHIDERSHEHKPKCKAGQFVVGERSDGIRQHLLCALVVVLIVPGEVGGYLSRKS